MKNVDVKTIAKSLRFISIPKMKLAIIMGLMLSETLINIVQPILWGYMLEYVIQLNVISFVKSVILLLLLYFVESVVIYAKTFLSISISENIAYTVKKDIFSRIINYPMELIDKMGVGELLSHLEGDVDTVVDVYTNQFVNVAMSILKAIIVCVIAVTISWPLAILIILSFPLNYLVINRYGNVFRADQDKMRKSMDNYYNKTQEYFLGISCIKVFGAKAQVIKKFDKIVKKNKDIGIHIGKTTAASSGVVGFINFATQILVYGMGMILMLQNKLIFAHFVAFSAYTATLTDSLLEITQVNPKLKQAMVSVERINKIFEEFDENQECWGQKRIPSLLGELEIRKISFAYESKKVFTNLSIKFEQGKKYAIVGPSGSGKSTLLKLIVKLYNADQGKIYLKGIDISELKEDDFRKTVGIVQQEPVLFGMSVFENIKMGNPEADIQEIYSAAKKAKIYEEIMELPDRFETVINSKGDNLSLGQKQRITFARTILQNPQIFLFDEVTSSLDNLSQMLINETINSLRTLHTLIVVSHDISNVIDADKIIVIKSGQIVGMGTHKELLVGCGEYQRLFESK